MTAQRGVRELRYTLKTFSEPVQGVLTGDGADELLCGYSSFRYVNWWKHVLWKRGSRAPGQTKVQELLAEHPLGSMPLDELYVRRFTAHARHPWLSGSSQLINDFDTDRVFERTGLGASNGFLQLQKEFNHTASSDSYQQAHLGASVQTAIALSILQRSLVEDTALPRKPEFEARYLGLR